MQELMDIFRCSDNAADTKKDLQDNTKTEHFVKTIFTFNRSCLWVLIQIYSVWSSHSLGVGWGCWCLLMPFNLLMSFSLFMPFSLRMPFSLLMPFSNVIVYSD